MNTENTITTEKPWLPKYPPGVPHEINPDSYPSIVDLIADSCKKYGSKPCFSNMGKTLTYRDIEQLSARFASYLQNVAGLQPGDRIALQMPNVLQYPVAMFGALRAGLIIVNTNPLYTPREMLHQFKDSGAKAIVILANFAHHLQEILPQTDIKTVIVTEIGDLLPFPKRLIVNAVVKYIKKMVPGFDLPRAIAFRQALSQGDASFLRPVALKSSDTAFLQYTGGTTGVSKGAILTHRNIIANMEQMRGWMSPLLKEGEEIIVTPLPLYHIFSLTVNCLAFMGYGARNILITNPRDIPGFIKELKQERFTVLTGVNTLFNALLNHPDFRQIDFSSMKLTVGGAMAVQQAVAERWKQVTGLPLVEGYGLTEASPGLCCNPIGGGERIGTIGLPIPSTDIAIRDPEGNDLPPGQPGELCARGPQITQGYWQRPEESASVIKNGWLHTGDIAQQESDGFFRIVDRQKDMILVSGFNVYPNEVEDVIAMNAKVLEVAVIGIQDEKSGEAVKAFIVKKDQSLTKEEVIAHCRESLTGYKVPHHVEFRTELPKTNVGKILRRALRDEDKKTQA